MPSFGNFLGRSVSEAAGFGAGIALGPALHPVVREIVNRTWALHPDMPLAPGEAAAIAAELIDQYDRMATEASYSGIDGSRFRDLYGVTLTAPGFGELVRMLRRGTITRDDFDHGLRKAKLEARWDTPLEELRDERLTPAQLALGIVRSVVTDPGLLVVTLDTSNSNVPRYKPLSIDPLVEAAAAGIDRERLRGMVGEIGLPASIQQAASAHFRHLLTRGGYNLAVLQSDTRPEWGDVLLEQARQIPTAHDGVEDHLRGWVDAAGMYATTARHGMSEADTDLLFRITGRPLSWHQVWIGLQRGGIYDGPIDMIDPAFLKALRESNIRPEWYNLAWHSRYTYPSAFVERALVSDGTLTAAQGEADLLDMGWRPDRAKQAAEKWAASGGTKANPWVAKADNQLWTALHKSYIAGESDAATVAPDFTALGIPADDHATVLDRWNREAALVRRQLTPAQIKRAFTHSAVNEATGAPWTRDEALAALVALGYAPIAAGDYLNL